MMTIFYDIIFLLFSIVYLPYLLLTGRYHREIWQRFGFYPKDIFDELAGKGVIWVHAVSVGEVMAARIFCESIIERFPQKRLFISTITKTGNDTAKRFFKDKATVLYLPIDISWVLKKVLDSIEPELFIIVETEIWPNLITALHKRDIPVVLVNGRISPKSYKRYIKIRPLVRPILEKMALFCMQSEEYKMRIRNMGAPADRIVVTGNMKFDAASSVSGILDVDAIKNDLNLRKDEVLFIAGSTHKPEERIILEVYKKLREDLPNLRLLIAPRHIERAPEIETLIRRFNLIPVRISTLTKTEAQSANRGSEVLILDTMGRLNRLFSIATIVFMGGSLMRKGGQNILEPAVFSKPVIFGPFMFNFKDIKEAFLREDAACMVKDRVELLQVSSALLKDRKRREGLGSRARQLVDKNKGATQRNIGEITKIIETKNLKLQHY